jgi:hypothetical protein
LALTGFDAVDVAFVLLRVNGDSLDVELGASAKHSNCNLTWILQL